MSEPRCLICFGEGFHFVAQHDNPEDDCPNALSLGVPGMEDCRSCGCDPVRKACRRLCASWRDSLEWSQGVELKVSELGGSSEYRYPTRLACEVRCPACGLVRTIRDLPLAWNWKDDDRVPCPCGAWPARATSRTPEGAAQPPRRIGCLVALAIVVGAPLLVVAAAVALVHLNALVGYLRA